MENLILMTDFVLEQKALKIMRLVKLQRIEKYANFLKQPLKLWMFVPCDTQGNALKIIPFKEHKQGSNFEFLQHHYYDIAKEICLFEGCFYEEEWHIVRDSSARELFYIPIASKMTIEWLVKYELKLTEAAKKMFI